MNRKECEEAILHKLLEIRDIYKQYNDKGEYLNLFLNDGVASFNNEYWPQGKDEAAPIKYYIDLMAVHEPAFYTPEGRILDAWAKKEGLDPNEYSIIICDVDSIRKGDVITIQPACYDDLPRCAHVVDEEPRPRECNGKITGMVLCGFVFDVPGTEVILRRHSDGCWSPM